MVNIPILERLSSQELTGRSKLIIVDRWFRKAKVEVQVEVRNTFETTQSCLSINSKSLNKILSSRTEHFWRMPTPTEAIYVPLTLIDTVGETNVTNEH